MLLVVGLEVELLCIHYMLTRINQESVRIYVDNLLICELMNNDSVPFDNPHYLILNVAMGGTLGGDIPGDFIQDSMEIDFVRFYK